jgi:flavin reductase (DIM6/NTAB) family NADH-FMN oxidoreductase RutF
LTATTTCDELREADLNWWTASNQSFDAAVEAASAFAPVTPAIDPRELRNALGRFATGVCVVTTGSAGGPTAGLTVNSFSSVSLEPPLVAWCLARTAPSARAFSAADHFCVHVMAQDQRETALHFARPAHDKFAPLSDQLERGIGGVPVLKKTLARFECRKASVVDGGDHLIFIGRVEGFSYSDAPPLLFHAGRFLETT